MWIPEIRLTVVDLPAPLSPSKPTTSLCADVEAQVPQRRQRAKALGDIVQFEKIGCGHHAAPRRSMRWLKAAATTISVAMNMSR